MNTETNIQKFKKEIIELCKKFNLSISHQDHHGAFIIKNYNNDDIEWFLEAEIDSEVKS